MIKLLKTNYVVLKNNKLLYSMFKKNLFFFMGVILLSSFVVGPKLHEGLTSKQKKKRKKCRKTGGSWNMGTCTYTCKKKEADNYNAQVKNPKDHTKICEYTCTDNTADNTGAKRYHSKPCVYNCRNQLERNPCDVITKETCDKKTSEDPDGKKFTFVAANTMNGICCDYCKWSNKPAPASSGGGGGSTQHVPKKKKKSGSFICTALYKNNYISKDDYRLMTLFGVLSVKTKKYEKDMMLYFTCMKYLMPYVEKKEKNNKRFWDNLKIFFVHCIKNLKEEKYDNVIKLFTIKSISMAEKYCGGLKNIPNLPNKIYNQYKPIYKKNKKKYNINAMSFKKLI